MLEGKENVLAVSQEGHGVLHCLHTYEEKPETYYTVPYELLPLCSSRNCEEHPEADEGKSELLDLEGYHVVP